MKMKLRTAPHQPATTVVNNTLPEFNPALPWTFRVFQKLIALQYLCISRRTGKARSRGCAAAYSVLVALTQAWPPDLTASRFGVRIARTVLNGLVKIDQKFFHDLAKSLSPHSGKSKEMRRRLYEFMLQHAGEISNLSTTKDIHRFIGAQAQIAKFDFSNFAALCREVKLPADLHSKRTVPNIPNGIFHPVLTTVKPGSSGTATPMQAAAPITSVKNKRTRNAIRLPDGPPPPLPVPWTVKLIEKMWMLRCPRLTQRNKYGHDYFRPGYFDACRIIFLAGELSESKMAENPQVKEITQIILRAIFRQDQQYLSDFSKGLHQPEHDGVGFRLQIYEFMLANHQVISIKNSVTKIWEYICGQPRQPRFNSMSGDQDAFVNFATLCREIGLPVSGSKSTTP